MYERNIVFEEDKSIYDDFAKHALRGESGSIEVRMKYDDKDDDKDEDKEAYGFHRLTWIPVKNENGDIEEVVGKVVDVQTVKDLEEKAQYDALTKTLNKRAMLESTSHILKRSTIEDKHALFFMDLDDFKYVNDNLGHIFGDFLLSELGIRLQDCIRYHDLVGRVGGDEFVIFLRDIPNVDTLMGKAKMILSTISEDFSDGTIHHNIHGSLGIAVYPTHGKTYEELYHHADLALYHSKRSGKNLVTMFSEELRTDHLQ